VVSTLKEALEGCRLIFGTSGRARTLSLPILTPRAAAKIILNSLSEKNKEDAKEGESESNRIGTGPTTKADIAILYGNEQHGLTNEELDFCHYQIQIPTNSNYASINLAAAVQIISYELFSNYSSNFILNDLPNDKISLASLPTSENLTEFYETLEKLLIEINFLNPMQPGYLMTRLKQLFSRAQLDKTELTLLRGIISAIQQKLL
jgi:tRNA (cytidine32/uridine32-2'-O)-methyltransferase